MTLIMKHWTEGGTGVTNFSPDKFDLYKESVRLYGDPSLIVCDQAYPPAPPSYGGSLHWLKHKNTTTGYVHFDLSAFWELFRDIELGIKIGSYNPSDPIKAYDRAMKGIK